MLRRMASVRTDVSEELSTSFIRVVPSSQICVTLMMGRYVLPKRRFLQEPHGVTSQKTPFFNSNGFFRLNLLVMFTLRSLDLNGLN
jgi:hypothetical protein